MEIGIGIMIVGGIGILALIILIVAIGLSIGIKLIELDRPVLRNLVIAILIIFVLVGIVGSVYLAQFVGKKSAESVIEQTETYEATGVVARVYTETKSLAPRSVTTIYHTIIKCGNSYYDVTSDSIYKIFGTEGTNVNLTIKKIELANESTLYRITSINNIECKGELVETINQTK